MSRITAQVLIDLLALKHSKDVFVAECKNGPTWHTSGLLKLDAWAMPRSWAHPAVQGYEAKISRQDFDSDTKWPGYLAYCNEFSFVCPSGLIQPEEMAQDVGLYWASKNGNRLYRKKKAVYREVSIPEEFWRYILMCRAQIVPSHHYAQATREEQAAWWARWYKEKRDMADMGHRISSRLAHLHRQKVLEVESKQVTLEKRIEGLSQVEALLAKMGVDPATWDLDRRLRERWQELQQAMPRNFMYDLHSLERVLRQFILALEAQNPDPVGGPT